MIKAIAIILTVLTVSVIGADWLMAANPSTMPSQPASTQPGVRETFQRLLEQSPPVTPVTETSIPSQPKDMGLPDQPPVTPSQGAALGGQKLLPEGHFVRDRRGRLIHIASQWMFTFESDGKALADPPILLLPNGWLEKMELDAGTRSDSVVFSVSGEVTVYHGKNYLLLRKVLMERPTSPLR